MIKIVSKREPYRRCGIAHTKAGTTHEASTFTVEQLAALQADPNLIVIEVTGEAATSNSTAMPPKPTNPKPPKQEKK